MTDGDMQTLQDFLLERGEEQLALYVKYPGAVEVLLHYFPWSYTCHSCGVENGDEWSESQVHLRKCWFVEAMRLLKRDQLLESIVYPAWGEAESLNRQPYGLPYDFEDERYRDHWVSFDTETVLPNRVVLPSVRGEIPDDDLYDLYLYRERKDDEL